MWQALQKSDKARKEKDSPLPPPITVIKISHFIPLSQPSYVKVMGQAAGANLIQNYIGIKFSLGWLLLTFFFLCFVASSGCNVLQVIHSN